MGRVIVLPLFVKHEIIWKMEWTIVGLATAFLLTGTFTTLLTKYSDSLKSVGIDGEERYFHHPFLQAWGLSIGEFICILIYFAFNYLRKSTTLDNEEEKQNLNEKNESQKKEENIEERNESPKKKSFSPFLFVPPAIMHLISRSLGYMALTLTSASSYQIISGSNLIFVCILSRIFLKKILTWTKWIGVFFISMGIVVVGLSDVLDDNHEHDDQSNTSNGNGYQNAILGDVFALCSMIFWAGQMTYEEKYVKKYKIKPLNCLGLEGTFSLISLTCMLVVFYFIKVPWEMNQPYGQLEDALDGFVQLSNNPKLMASFIGVVVLLVFTSLAAISITIKLSAIHRIIINTGRQIMVWAISLALSWQIFQPLQVIGFFIMVIGVLIFNDLIIGPAIRNILKRLGFLKEEEKIENDL